MCESKVYLRKDGSVEEVMDDVAHLRVTGDGVVLVRIDGVRKELNGVRVSEVDFIHHKAYLEPS